MAVRFVVIVAAVLLCEAALLYVADHKSLLPTGPHSTSLFQVRWPRVNGITHAGIGPSRASRRRSHVRFGSKGDICSAKRHVRFTPNSDRESEIPKKVMSALPESGHVWCNEGCPLWANSGHNRMLACCPLYLQLQTLHSTMPHSRSRPSAEIRLQDRALR